MIPLILTGLGVVLASGICSGSEAALLSMPLTRAQMLAEQGGTSAKALAAIREDPSDAISTIVVLNNIANIVGSMAVAALATEAFGSAALGAVSFVMTLSIILLSEILPKALGERYAEPIGLLIARPLSALAWLFQPVLLVLGLVTRRITGHRGPLTDEEEIAFLARSGGFEGAIEPDESQMIQRVFLLNDFTAGQLMTPRTAVDAVRAASTMESVRDKVMAVTHSRLVVMGKHRDDPVGLVLRVDLMRAMVHGKWDAEVSDFVRPALYVPMDARADGLLAMFRGEQTHLAIVVDDFGGVAGVVTLEDVLEVLTGDIVDETDRAADLQEVARASGLLDRTRTPMPDDTMDDPLPEYEEPADG